MVKGPSQFLHLHLSACNYLQYNKLLYRADFPNMFSSASNKSRLRRSTSTRSIQRQTGPTPDLAMQQAAAAASKAMRSNQGSSQRSSQESRASYDHLGGPANIAVPRRRPGSSLQRDSPSTQHSPAFSTPCVPKSKVKSAATKSLVEDAAVLPPITEFKGLDGRDSSVPSSYRRLRKAKSMFATRPRTSQTPYGVPPLPCGDPSDLERSPGFQLPRTMRPSMPFIRGAYRSQASNSIDLGAHDAAVKLARSQFAQEPCETIPRHRRPSFLLGRKKDHKPFRKSFRATSEPLSESSASQCRSFSSSIKNRLKRVFGFSKAVEQQSALRGDLSGVDAVALADPTVGNLRRNGSETDRCPPSNSFRELPASPSQDSVCTAKSRVTSWADSTVANTVTTRKPGHRQSLSMISEDRGRVFGLRTPCTPSKNEVGSLIPPALRPSPRPIGLVNSQDLYHALMEQIGHNDLADSNEIVFGSVTKHRVVPERSGSVISQHGKRQTVRPVRSLSSSPRSFATAFCGNQPSPYKSPPPSTFVIGECSDGDSDGNSVIVAHSRDPRRDVISPSIYSRSTGGNTPVKADPDDTVHVGSYDEPGTATIFASERTAYVSPKRAARVLLPKTCVNPSGDWQQWINSQVDKIEQTSPLREHVREEAQFEEDDEDLATLARQATVVVPTPASCVLETSGSEQNTMRNSIVETRVPSQSNFSRPFSHVSHTQSILPLQTVKLENPKRNVSTDSFKGTTINLGEDISPKLVPFAQPAGLSPIRLRSGNMQSQESPTPKRVGLKRSLTKEQQRRYSARRAPVAQDGRANQFRSMRSQRDSHANNENLRQQEEYDNMMESYHQLQDIHSTISSKRMVDLFLDSRRQRTSESTDGKASTEAFL
ncbi:unnamed protein product [Penicillium salamii]|uniref:Uncharacterized protein n=1 Tax=Penicillium salamii TaxID=1612424 RepID=A0A9W4JNB6_9EURO|nr:unnamed protein product [Penicillium salamii]CAG8346884.1 unnamed protein product [Penicillium salamii]CAG8368137.1 unnamed protein product [Penicillium salamii]CAG8376934.1 unnamed protein product [Penicillium salamii]CAG8379190.1 unnamed protein product [Penicillium salamii]